MLAALIGKSGGVSAAAAGVHTASAMIMTRPSTQTFFISHLVQQPGMVFRCVENTIVSMF